MLALAAQRKTSVSANTLLHLQKGDAVTDTNTVLHAHVDPL